VSYIPKPIDTSGVSLTPDIVELTEQLAANAHDHWAKQRMSEGWRFGPNRDDTKKEHPCLIPYNELPDSEKEYDRKSAMETIKSIQALGYRIVK
jgi:ryanodine receptor 2